MNIGTIRTADSVVKSAYRSGKLENLVRVSLSNFGARRAPSLRVPRRFDDLYQGPSKPWNHMRSPRTQPTLALNGFSLTTSNVCRRRGKLRQSATHATGVKGEALEFERLDCHRNAQRRRCQAVSHWQRLPACRTASEPLFALALKWSLLEGFECSRCT